MTGAGPGWAHFPDEPPSRLVQTSGYAIGALVFALLPTCGIGSILAIVLGRRARREIDAPGSRLVGRGMATTGIVFGWIGVVVSAVALVLVATALISGASVR